MPCSLLGQWVWSEDGAQGRCNRDGARTVSLTGWEIPDPTDGFAAVVGDRRRLSRGSGLSNDAVSIG